MELLAPAGNREKLELAITYGADAVYLGGDNFSLRNQSGNFTLTELKEAIAFAHAANVKVYLTCNIYPRNHEVGAIGDFLKAVGALEPDAFIIADPGVLMLANRVAPHVPVHLSTQANTTSYAAVQFWQSLNVCRVNMARELSLSDIAVIHNQVPDMELEAFVHGAMCISHSGRCLMSSFMSNRDSNRGLCAHPCRWQYYLVEEQRPGLYHPVLEDERGTYFFNSRDLCMLPYIDKMAQSGIASLKIEGRMKTVHYLATVLRVYRMALNAYLADPLNYKVEEGWLSELETVNTRGYTTGFYLGDENALIPDYDNTRLQPQWLFAAKIQQKGTTDNIFVEARNQLKVNDYLAVISPHKNSVCNYTLIEIKNIDNESIQTINPSQSGYLTLKSDSGRIDMLDAFSIIRKFVKN